MYPACLNYLLIRINALIIRLVLLLFVTAIASFLLAIVFDELMLISLAALASQFGTFLLLLAFSVFVLVGLGVISKLITASLRAYFSAKQRIERKLLFYNNKQYRLMRLFQYKKARVLYFSKLKRSRLSQKYERKSVRS